MDLNFVNLSSIVKLLKTSGSDKISKNDSSSIRKKGLYFFSKEIVFKEDKSLSRHSDCISLSSSNIG